MGKFATLLWIASVFIEILEHMFNLDIYFVVAKVRGGVDAVWKAHIDNLPETVQEVGDRDDDQHHPEGGTTAGGRQKGRHHPPPARNL